MAENWTWEQMIGEFRALGGVAENVCQKTGAFGRGIFPIDAAKPVEMRVPDNLLFKVDDVTFINGSLVAKDGLDIASREKAFLENYEANFSWGGNGHADCSAFVDSLDSLPENIREILINDFGSKAIFDGDRLQRIQKKFLQSRTIRYRGHSVIMPIIELVNHSVGGRSYDLKDGVALHGTFAGEAFARYNLSDALGMLMTWGFANEEPLAFSLPLRLTLGSRQLVIGRRLREGKELGKFRVPTVKTEGERIALSHLVIGHTKFPRLPKGIFYRLMQDAGISNAEESFDQILHFNRMKFLHLLLALESHQGPFITSLRETCHYQLLAMSFCIGTRAL